MEEKKSNPKNFILPVVTIIAVLVVLGTGLYLVYQQYTKSITQNDNNEQLIGGDKDEHGCLIAAGYSWCQAKEKCLRTWEETCEEQVFCAQDVKLCDDGSYVSRTGPNCEFAECPQTNSTANWKTYTNTQYGFEFKYPNDWYTVNDDCSNKDMLFLNIGVSEKQKLEPLKCSYFAVNVINENFMIGTRDYKDIKIGQIDGEMDSLTCNQGCLIFDRNNNDIVIRISKNPFSDEITNKILSSFKFTK